MQLHLCGLPLKLHRRLKEESLDWENALPEPHRLLVTPINSPSPRPFKRAEVDEIRTAVGEGFTHIVLLGTRDWKSIANGLEFDCRVHTLRIQVDYHSMAWEDVRAALREVVDLDTEWKVRVAPSDLRHQLLLPPTFFSTDRQTRNFWKFCDVYSKGQIESAAELLRLVDRVHRKRSDGERVWVDARRLEYSVDPSLHSRANEERGGGALYRFCFPLPQGFHFDVRAHDGKRFEALIGERIRKVDYVNVTPWGHVRG